MTTDSNEHNNENDDDNDNCIGARPTLGLAADAGGRGSWGNTNRVVSNRVVSKGPLYPSKTKIIVFRFFDTTPFICL